MFFVIEGLDGVGKTTIGKIFAEKLNATLLKTPPKSFYIFHKFFQKRKPSNSSLLFYLFSVFLVSLRIALSSNKKTFICVRYLDSTIAYHAAFHIKTCLDCYNWLFKKPDYIIYLTVDESVRIKRLSGRNNISTIDLLSQNKDVCNSIKHHYNNMVSNIRLDTTKTTANDIVNILLKKMKTKSS